MAKVKNHKWDNKKKERGIRQFYNMLSQLKNSKEVKDFFHDLLTPGEIVMISRRISIAELLLRGASYDDITMEMGAGNSTIARVDNWLSEGLGDYRAIIDKCKEKTEKQDAPKRKRDYDIALSFTHIKNKYPAHFWLVDLLFGK